MQRGGGPGKCLPLPVEAWGGQRRGDEEDLGVELAGLDSLSTSSVQRLTHPRAGHSYHVPAPLPRAPTTCTAFAASWYSGSYERATAHPQNARNPRVFPSVRPPVSYVRSRGVAFCGFFGFPTFFPYIFCTSTTSKARFISFASNSSIFGESARAVATAKATVNARSTERPAAISETKPASR